MKVIDENNPPPTIDEQYSHAVGASNLRVQTDRRNVADMVIAAGMNPHRLGLALRRLATEWDATGKPPPLSDANIEAMAAKYPRVEGKGTVLFKVTGRDGKVTEQEMLPLVAATMEAEQWYLHELGMLFQRLKTLPEVRNGLVWWAEAEGYADPVHAVAAVLRWWLSPRCQLCKGVKKRVVLGTGRTSSKDCRDCGGTGEQRVPHGALGRRILGYINECQRHSAADLRGRFQPRYLPT